MSPTPDPPFDPQPQGISLDELAEAFAQVMVSPPRQSMSAAAAPEGPLEAVGSSSSDAAAADLQAGSGQPLEFQPSEPAAEEDSCPISPRTILEAMLFVGDRDNRPLSPGRVAELLRDVESDEVPSLVDELNRRYDDAGAPYQILGEEDGYRLVLRREFQTLGNRFRGRIREARLSQAAVDVLALVAYQQPIAGEAVGRLRGKPSRHVLAHLVQRGLLRIERPDPKRRTPHYYTTDRFLKLFNLESLDDLPQSEDSGPP